MAFAFKPNDDTALTGARRIARQQLDTALGLLDAPAPPSPDRVHALRKHTKKLRGLVRLVLPVTRRLQRQNLRLRDAARQIAPLRDAEVRRGTFDLLTRDMDREPGIQALRRLLQQDVAAVRQPASLERITEGMRGELRAVRDALDGWALRKRYGGKRMEGAEAGFAVLRPGLETTWGAAQAGLAASRAALAGDFAADPFHEWRKAAKHHWYQARLLRPIWPEVMAPHVAAADTLGELLGDHNDLDVLCAFLQSRVDAGDCPEGAAALPALRAEVLQPRRLLAEKAVALGERLFAPPARAVTDQWAAWWCAWHR